MNADYLARREFGLPYLRSAPRHWDVFRLKFVATTNDAALGEDTDPDLEIAYIDIGNVDGRGQVLEEERMSFGVAPSRARRLPTSGDTLVSTVRTYLKAIAYLDTEPDGPLRVCSTGFAVLRPGARLFPKYLFYYLRSTGVVDEICARSTGVSYPAINASEIGNILALVPPFDEQVRISAFLDERTAAIDELIGAKTRLLEALNRKRRAVIGRAVTRGVAQEPDLLESGIRCLGRVPNHWQVQRLKFALRRIEQGWSPQCENRAPEDDEWGVLKVGCVNGWAFDPTEAKALPASLEPVAEYEVREGDVLMSRANTRELVGSAGIVPEVRGRLLLCDKLYRLSPDPVILDAAFLTLYLRSTVARDQMEADATGTSGSMQNIGQDTVKNLMVALPPIDEQRAIVHRVRAHLLGAFAAESALGQQLDVLRRRRHALITDAVTGRIDVRSSVGVSQ